MTAKEMTYHLRGKWHGRYGTAPCPICQFESRPDQDALTVTDGYDRLLANCKRSNCAFQDILAAAGAHSSDWTPPDPAIAAKRREEEKQHDQRRAAQAKAIWLESLPINGTIVEGYLRGRGIICDLPLSLRFHPECWHGPTAKRYPSMIGAVTRLDGPSAPSIHRTYLRADGSGKADVEPAKTMLGRTAGGCVRLRDGAGALIVAEGIESGLSLAHGLLNVPDPTIVAALSTSGMCSLALPPKPGRLIAAGDGDEAGRKASRDLSFTSQMDGWSCSTTVLPDGLDWNDRLIGRAA